MIERTSEKVKWSATWLLGGALLLIACPAPSPGGEAQDSRALPNIVLIMADDMGFECLGSNGSTYLTPHLDRLAAGGIRFVHGYSQPLCTPSRVKIMTGKYNFRNYTEFGYLDPAERTFGPTSPDKASTRLD